MSRVKSKSNRSFSQMIASGKKVDLIKRVMHNYYQQYYTLDRCVQTDEDDDYYLCEKHEKEQLVIKKTIKRDRKDVKATLNLLVPKPTGLKNQPAISPSKGIGVQRMFTNNIESLNKEIDDLDPTATKKY